MPNTSQKDFYELGLAGAKGANADLTVYEGDIVDMFINAAATMADRCDQERAEDHKSSHVDGAEGDDLTTLADDHFDIDRNPATSAQTTARFTRPSDGGSEPAGTLSAGFEVATAIDASGNDVRYILDADASFGIGDLGPVDVAVTAVATGPDGNGVTGTISILIGTPFDSSIAVTSTTDAAGGNNEESDPEVRQRIRDRPKTLRRATKQALVSGALEVESVRVASPVEDTATGSVTMAVSDSDGNSNLQMVNDVILNLEEWRAFGIPVAVVGGVKLTLDMTVNLTLASGAAIAGLVTPVTDSISGSIDKLSQGDVLYDTLIKASGKNVSPEFILDVTITAMSIDGTPVTIGDYSPASNELVRAGTITVTS